MQQKTTDWRLVLLIWAAGLGAGAQYGKISVVFDRLTEIWPDAGAALGFTVSLVGFLGILLGIVAGLVVARIGYRRALLWALVTAAVMSAIQATFPPLWLFLLTRVIEGAAHLAIVVAAPTMIAQIASDGQRSLALSLWSTFFSVAFAVLAWFGVPLARAWGIGALIGAHALYMAALAAILWPILPRVTGAAARLPGLREIGAAHLRIYTSPNIGAAAWGWLFYAASFVAILTVLPPFLPEGTRALVLGAVPLMSILTSMTLGVWLLRRIPAVKVLIAGFALSAGVAVLLWLFPGAPPLALLLGAVLGLIQGAGFACVPQLNDAVEDRALANGGMAQTGNLGNTLGTPVMVAAIALGGYDALMAVLCLIFLCGLGLQLLLARRRKRQIA